MAQQDDDKVFFRDKAHLNELIREVERQFVRQDGLEGKAISGNEETRLIKETTEKVGALLSGRDQSNLADLHNLRVYEENHERHRDTPPPVLHLPEGAKQQVADAGAGVRDASFRKLASTPELDRQLDEKVARDFAGRGDIIKADNPAVLKKYSQIMHVEGLDGIPAAIREMQDKVHSGVPEAKRMAAEVKLYVVNDTKVSEMRVETLQDPDGHAVMAIVMTPPEFTRMQKDGKFDTERFKSAIAHEEGHSLVQLNPELATNPRYQPKTPEFREQLQKIDPSRRARYTDEARADIIGHRINQNLEGDIERIRVGSNLNEADAIKDPLGHPSAGVREAEVRQADADMKAEQQRRAPIQQQGRSY